MNRQIARTAMFGVLCMLVAATADAQAAEGRMSGMMGSADSGSMPMMGGSMMNMMMGQGSGMGTMRGPGMMSCPMMGGGSMMGGGPMMSPGIGRMLQLPGLSSDQRQRLNDRSRQLQRQLLQLEGKALEARFGLEDASSAEMPDPKAVGRALQNVFAVRTQMVEVTISAANDARNLLTEEQRDALMSSLGVGGMHGGMMSRQ